MLRVLVMASGGGTNLQALLDAIEDKTVKDAAVTAVISNNRSAYALKRAAAKGIEAVCIPPGDYADRELFNQALLEAVEERRPGLIVLAGFLVKIPAEMVRKYPGRIINIHPSLIPSFCGKGYYGLKVHEAALQRGVKVTGATVHFVDEGTDTGPIILQQAVAVKEGDTPELLQKRVMEEAEWVILPRAVGLIAAGRVKTADGRSYIEDEQTGRERKTI